MSNSTKDIHVYESGSGGEFAFLNNDLVLVEALYQAIYISLFGGNIEASTVGNEIKSEERFDYWANSLLFPNEIEKRYNSETERTLNSVVLNSSGRLKIESAVKQDLKFLSNIVEYSVDIFILSRNRIEIRLVLKAIPNQADKQIQFIWDNAKREIVINRDI